MPGRSLLSFSIALAFVWVSSCATPVRPAPPADPCRALPLLARLEQSGLVSRTGADAVALDLFADLHTADCGAPDCYGTTLHVELDVASAGARCLARAASVRSQEWSRCPGDERTEPARTERFTADAVDLADLHAGRLVLRSKDRALVITTEGVFWFDQVVAGAPLHEAVPPDGAEPTDCCWAAMSSGAKPDIPPRF